MDETTAQGPKADDDLPVPLILGVALGIAIPLIGLLLIIFLQMLPET